MTMFTAAQRRSLERLSGLYTHLSHEESDFTLSDVFSIGILLSKATSASKRNLELIQFYKSAYVSLTNALHVHYPELFLLRLSNKNTEPWDDFSDFKSVWYPKWFQNQLWLRESLFQFCSEEEQKIRPDFWGATSSDEEVKNVLLSVRDSYKQIRVGVLAMVFKIDHALANLIGWEWTGASVSWKILQEKFAFPTFHEDFESKAS